MARADTETITWYVDDSVYDTTTCQSGGDVILPTAPTPPYGYSFYGWTDTYDFLSIDTSVNGRQAYGHGLSETCRYMDIDKGVTSTVEESCSSQINYSDLVTQEWKTVFDYGTVYGMSLCSVTMGEYAVAGTPDEEMVGNTATYCWCKLEGIKLTSGVFLYKPLWTPTWLYGGVNNSRDACEHYCAVHCAVHVRAYSAMRVAIFSDVNN